MFVRSPDQTSGTSVPLEMLGQLHFSWREPKRVERACFPPIKFEIKHNWCSWSCKIQDCFVFLWSLTWLTFEGLSIRWKKKLLLSCKTSQSRKCRSGKNENILKHFDGQTFLANNISTWFQRGATSPQLVGSFPVPTSPPPSLSLINFSLSYISLPSRRLLAFVFLASSLLHQRRGKKKKMPQPKIQKSNS